ncbi:hypothetical protein Ptr902_04480 [Pyrenophora tritici-repentis]|nr:hypothetical protein Ptr902_04480 [Pyrenophora tritici-repentis]
MPASRNTIPARTRTVPAFAISPAATVTASARRKSAKKTTTLVTRATNVLGGALSLTALREVSVLPSG